VLFSGVLVVQPDINFNPNDNQILDSPGYNFLHLSALAVQTHVDSNE